MEVRVIGSLRVSVVGLGCNNFGWRLDQEGSASVVRHALDSGITFFDTADVYGGTKSEEYLGRGLGARRGEAVIATKFGSEIDEHRRGARPEYVRQALEASLRRLDTDYIDLYQLHRPDHHVPIEDTLGVLEELKKAGSIREYGVSNFSMEQLREAEEAASRLGVRIASVQNEYSLFERGAEEDVLPECAAKRNRLPPLFPAGQRTPDRQVPARAGAAERQPADDAGGRTADRASAGAGGKADRVRRGPRAHAPRPRRVLAGQPPRDRLRDCRRHDAGTSGGQFEGRGVEDDARGVGGDRQDRAARIGRQKEKGKR